ncbi:MAG: PQQ-binding-like beta-propeller repeat protein [Sphingobium sp.]
MVFWKRLLCSSMVLASSSAMAQVSQSDIAHLEPGVELSQGQITNLKPVSKADLLNPDPADWPMYRRNYQGWGFSPLDQIKPDNVKNLHLAWSRAMEPGWQQSTPIVHNGVIFLGATKDVIQAINAKNGDLIWEYRRKHPKNISEYNILGRNKRSIALYGDKVYFGSWDNAIVALDAKTGKLVWETDRGDGPKGVSNSTGPIVVDGVVIAGTTCQYSGIECYVTGHDAETGKELWRARFLPKKGQKGYDTWGGMPEEKRWGTSSWGAITYDPELNLVYYGSNGAMPISEAQRKTPGASLYGTNTRFAIRPKTGEIVWSRQVLPRDNWEQDCVFEMMPLTTAVNPDAQAQGMMAVGKVKGQTRKVLTGVPCKTGLMWTLDAKTGEFLWVKSTTKQNLVSSVDAKGDVKINEALVISDPGKPVHQCPPPNGGKDWPPSAYNPKRHAMFVPLSNLCGDTTVFPDEPTPEAGYNADFTFVIPEEKGDKLGRIDAISVETGKTLWTYEQRAALYSPILATAGDLLFTGGFDRYFRAIDQADGKVVWETRLPSQVTGHAVSYAVDGKQYIAVPAGGSLLAGYMQSLQSEVDGVTGSNALFVFSLD